MAIITNGGPLQELGRFSTGVFGADGGAAEIPAYDSGTKRLFVVNAVTRKVDVLDLRNPASPTKVAELDMGDGVPNSVAVQNGIVAVAVEDAVKTNPGRVLLFTPNGTLLNTLAVGALPDMLTFSPNGRWLLVANEGEPNSYNQANSVDPEGSVSVIDLANGAAGATVRTASFTSFNSQIDTLRTQGVRIFGPNATVAQDLEPEYITISGDSRTAYVVLQEANAIATVDIASATVTAIRPLGLKDFSAPTITTTLYEWTAANRPPLGVTSEGQQVLLGGFSGLFYEGRAANGNLRFITTTDRGPNGEPQDLNPGSPGNERPFALPNFQPRFVRFELNTAAPAGSNITNVQQILLTKPDGTPLTGLPNVGTAANQNLAYNDEIPVDLTGAILPFDKLGADLEGLVVAADGTFWAVDEYRPAIYQFSSTGRMLERFIPAGGATADGTFGTATLPAVYAQRRPNRGFEAVALEGNKLYAFIQSPIDNPDNAANTVSTTSRNIRILEFDISTKQVTGEYLYIFDAVTAPGTARTDKIGDAVSLGNGRFLVVERDDVATNASNKLVYEISLANATNINNAANFTLPAGTTIEQLQPAQLTTAGIRPVSKRLVVNAAAVGYSGTGLDKIEGLALIDPTTIAVINDNDFGVSGAGLVFPVDNAARPVQVGIISGLGLEQRTKGLDPSDQDDPDGAGARTNVGRIGNWQVFGAYQPDAIASYTVDGQTYIVTANEGDARDYTGFSEEIRVNSIPVGDFDPIVFPNAATLRTNAQLGRLNITNQTGRTTADGAGSDATPDYEKLVTFGTRSFSIFNATTGALVYDSGDEIERLMLQFYPGNFNANHSGGGGNNLDDRSDNKGPEPEGLVLGKINGRTYVFIGLERIGGVMVYDITSPTAPTFVQYINSRNFTVAPTAANLATVGDLGPEGLAFISAADSPSGKPLVVVANEISGTVAIFEFDATRLPTTDTTAPSLVRGNNNLFSINGSIRNAAQTLRFTVGQVSSSFVNEMGVFVVDDDQGTIDGVAPTAANYLQLALSRAQVICTTLPNNPQSGSNSRSLNYLNLNERLVFYLIPNASTDTALANLAAGRSQTVLFASTFGGSAFQQARFSSQASGGFTISWEDQAGGGDQDFNDFVLNVQLATTNTRLADITRYQGRREGELIDLRSLTGNVGVSFTVNSEAAFNNTVGLYRVDDPTGRIGTLAPGDAGYAQAALRDRLVMSSGRDGTNLNNLAGGNLLAPFLVANGTVQQFLAQNANNQSSGAPIAYFAYINANPDRVDHIRLLGDNTFGFEDLIGGGDQDFNDIVFRVNFT
jgi:hypothetical protein